MSKQTISLGTAPSGTGGDTPRSAFTKSQANFDELYAALGGTGSPVALPAALPVAQGGTGAITVVAARIALGLATATVDAVPMAKGGTGRTDGRFVLSELGVQQAPALYNTQGMYFGWNAGGVGEGNFIVNQGGGAGGFTWRSVNSDNSLSGPTMTYSYSGILTVTTLAPVNALGIAYGGTGAKTGAAACNALGLNNGGYVPQFAYSKVAGVANAIIGSGGGSYIGWNESAGNGEFNFTCNRGGGSGGFAWRTINSDNTATGPSMNYAYAGNLTVPGTVTQGSDQRLKTNVVEIVDGLEKILQVRPVEFDRKAMITDTEYPFHEAGVIAQELNGVLPIAVTEGSDTEAWRVNYISLIPYLIGAIKELKAEVEGLKTTTGVTT